jgi:hypothetical protein
MAVDITLESTGIKKHKMNRYFQLKKISAEAASRKISAAIDDAGGYISHSQREDLANAIIDCELQVFVAEKKDAAPIWLRFTLPIAVIAIIILILFLPINFLITGRWTYKNSGITLLILNWFSALKIA